MLKKYFRLHLAKKQPKFVFSPASGNYTSSSFRLRREICGPIFLLASVEWPLVKGSLREIEAHYIRCRSAHTFFDPGVQYSIHRGKLSVFDAFVNCIRVRHLLFKGNGREL